VSAGQRCLRLFAWKEARELAIRGSHFTAELPDLERVSIQIELYALQVLTEWRSDLDSQLSLLAAEARRLGLAAVEARAFFLRSVLQYHAGDSKAAFESSLSRADAARQASAIDRGVELAGAARCCLLLERNLDVAAEFVAEAQSILGEKSEQLDLVWSQGLFAHLCGDFESAAERLRLTLSIARREQRAWEEGECLLALAWLDLDRGLSDEVIAHADALSAVAAKLGEGGYAPVARALRTLAEASRSQSVDLTPFEASLDDLHALEANRLLALLQNRAARIALRTGARPVAQRQAEQAVAAAERVMNTNEATLARTTLAELAILAGESELARRHLAELPNHSAGAALSLRAAREIERVRELFSKRTKPEPPASRPSAD
jgi:hypothetical protein